MDSKQCGRSGLYLSSIGLGTLTWVRDYPGISSALVGPRTARQLDTLLEYTATLPAPIREVLSEVAQ